MPRTLTADAIDMTATQFGAEPITIIGVFWNGTQEIKYADRDVGAIPGRIQEVSSLDDVVKVQSASSSASIDVTLDDTPGDIKRIMQTTDIHKKKCIVYQYFAGLALSDAYIVFVGQINTPIVWNEAERKLSFTILSDVTSTELGFAPEEGQFPGIASSAIGKAWPLGFGDVVNVPAVKITEQIRGATQTLIGIADYTLPYKYDDLSNRYAELINGINYYLRAISYLTEIARRAEAISDDYIRTILFEDPLKQYHEDLATLIANNDKVAEKLAELLRGNTGESFARTVEVSALNGSPNTQRSTVLAIQQFLQDRNDVQNFLNQILSILGPAKQEILNVSQALNRAQGVKKLLEIEAENAEYAYKNIISIAKKITQASIEVTKTLHEVDKLTRVMFEQSQIVQDQVSIIGGSAFPQNVPVRITIKGMTYGGSFDGDLFTSTGIEPRYTNVAIGPREDDSIDAFWITDPNINLKGQFCLTTVPVTEGDPEYTLRQYGYPIGDTVKRLFKVVDQIGTKCVIELRELKPYIRLKNLSPRFPLLKDLPDYIWQQLQGAQEHTINERERILENGIEKFEKSELDRVKGLVGKLYDLLYEGANLPISQDDLGAVQAKMFENIHEYNDRLASQKFTRQTIEKAFSVISEEEFKTLLKLTNLRERLVDQQSGEDFDSIITDLYYLTGDQISTIEATSAVMLPAWFQFSPEGQELISDSTVLTLPNGNQILTNFLPDSSLWFAEPGSEVKLVSNTSEKYVANIIPSTIAAVYGYKAVEGIRTLVPIPTTYYTKNEADTSYLPLTCTTITMYQPLRDYSDEDWEDGVYVSYRSSVGPNTAEEIAWLAGTYTNLLIDTDSYNYVAGRIDYFPSSFAFFEKKDTLAAMEEMAWQARCAIAIKNGILFFEYLSEVPDSLDTITESDIEFGSLTLEYSSSEDLVTKFVANWLPDYATKDKNQLILRYNLKKYGEIEKDYDFYIYNNQDLVNKSATFWLIRYANTWKRAKFKTPLTKLALETGDAITIDLASGLFSTDPVIAVIEKATYDSSTNSIDFECWIPIRTGEMTVYPFAHPADISTQTLYPSVAEINNGFAGSPHSAVPTNLAYRIQPNQSLIEQLNLRPKDYGEAFPSDGSRQFFPPSPLNGLAESNFLVQRPTNYVSTQQPQLSQDDNKPNYQSPVFRKDQAGVPGREDSAGNVGKTVGIFLAYVVQPINLYSGQYYIRDSSQSTYKGKQARVSQKPLEVGTSVLALYNPSSKEYDIFEGGGGLGTQLKSAVIVSEQADTLTCKTYDFKQNGNPPQSSKLANVDGEQFLVAKPRQLQKAALNGVSVTFPDQNVTYTYTKNGQRTAKGSLASNKAPETQIILPPYVAGDILIVAQLPTGIENADWVDLNNAGRQWAWVEKQATSGGSDGGGSEEEDDEEDDEEEDEEEDDFEENEG